MAESMVFSQGESEPLLSPTAVLRTNAMSSKYLGGIRRTEHATEHHSRDPEVASSDPDAEFGGTEARKKLEKRVVLKVDVRMFILVIIYILNFVS